MVLHPENETAPARKNKRRHANSVRSGIRVIKCHCTRINKNLLAVPHTPAGLS